MELSYKPKDMLTNYNKNANMNLKNITETAKNNFEKFKPLVKKAYTSIANPAKDYGKYAKSKAKVLSTQSTLNRHGYTDLQGNKLKEDGIWGDKTNTAFNKAVLHEKQIEKPSEDTRELQKFLNKNGIKDKNGEPLKEDGVLGPLTDSATNKATKLFDSGLRPINNDVNTKKTNETYPFNDGSLFASANPTSYVSSVKDKFVSQVSKFKNQMNYIVDAFKTGVDTAKEISKEGIRKAWETGANLLLESYYGYDSASWLLKHSLQDNPDDVYRDSNSRISKLVADSRELKNELIKILCQCKEDSFSENLSLTLSDGELGYSINRADIVVSGKKQPDGTWKITGTLTDLYDYSEIQTLEIKESNIFPNINYIDTDISLGTVANDAAYISSLVGAIHPYNIIINFELEM
ncbi:MAG: hypothetical protein IJC06_00275 [Clostridia bacterium]|nr:hypothetical protein [Clostridia bacterium]